MTYTIDELGAMIAANEAEIRKIFLKYETLMSERDALLIAKNKSNFDDIAERLKELRADRGLSLAKLAKLAGASKTNIWEIEKGRTGNPTLSIILKLCRALEVTPNYLLGFDDLSLYGDGEKPVEGG